MGILKDFLTQLRTTVQSVSKEDRDAKYQKYGVSQELVGLADLAESVSLAIDQLQSDPTVRAALLSATRAHSTRTDAAPNLYFKYVKYLGGGIRNNELREPLSTLEDATKVAIANMKDVERNFTALLDSLFTTDAEFRTSSLIVLGYLDQTRMFLEWVSKLYGVLTTPDTGSISKYTLSWLEDSAEKVSAYVTSNLTTWTAGGILKAVRRLQQRGLDVPVVTGDQYIDDYVEQNQFTAPELQLMGSSMFSPIMAVHNHILEFQDYLHKVDLARRDWLRAKIDYESRRIRGMDPQSPEAVKLHRVIDNYANMLSKYEQAVERYRHG
jgi:hypothetical protein